MVTKRLIGTDLDQIPRNKDLGVNAYIDSDYVAFNNAYIKNAELTGVASGETYNSNTPVASPTFYCDFAKTKTVDSRITFLRDSIATYIDADGLIKTVQPFQPRFDHDPITGKCKGVLVEEERTNLVTTSTYIAVAGDPDRMTRTAVTSLDGTANAYRLDINSSSDNGSLYISGSGIDTQYTANKVHTQSIYMKPGLVTYVLFALHADLIPSYGGVTKYAHFDLTNATVLNVEAPITSAKIDKIRDGWVRLQITATAEVSITTYANLIYAADVSGNKLSGSSYNNGDTIFYAWGGQLEEGSFATSYIPTSGGTVTRKADQMYISGPAFTSIYNPNEGTLVGYAYAKNGPPVVSGNRTEQYITLSDGSSSNRIFIQRVSNGTISYTFNSTPAIAANNRDSTNNLFVKFAGGFNSTETNVAYNGISLGSQGQGSYINLATMNKLSIGSAFDTANGFWNSTIAYVAYYPKKLIEIELQEITYL